MATTTGVLAGNWWFSSLRKGSRAVGIALARVAARDRGRLELPGLVHPTSGLVEAASSQLQIGPGVGELGRGGLERTGAQQQLFGGLQLVDVHALLRAVHHVLEGVVGAVRRGGFRHAAACILRQLTNGSDAAITRGYGSPVSWQETETETVLEMAGLDIAPGDRIGSYVYVRPVGKGGMATVVLARDPNDQEVALKILKASRFGTGMVRFRREFRALSRIRHPNVIRVDAYGDIVGESSNVDFADEALTRLTSKRAYEANLKVVAAAEEMTETLLDELG